MLVNSCAKRQDIEITWHVDNAVMVLTPARLYDKGLDKEKKKQKKLWKMKKKSWRMLIKLGRWLLGFSLWISLKSCFGIINRNASALSLDDRFWSSLDS